MDGISDEDGAGVEIAEFPDDEAEEAVDLDDEGDVLPELESGDDALLDDEDELPADFEGFDSIGQEKSSGEKVSKNQEKKEKKRKLKHLPTFASVEDYAKMLGDDDEEY